MDTQNPSKRIGLVGDQHHGVVHQVHVFVPIEWNPMGNIILEFASVDAINEPNATVKLWYNNAQHNLFFFIVSHYISSPIAPLMHLAMKMTSSQTTLQLFP